METAKVFEQNLTKKMTSSFVGTEFYFLFTFIFIFLFSFNFIFIFFYFYFIFIFIFTFLTIILFRGNIAPEVYKGKGFIIVFI
jgi:hypothetical protein